MVDVFCSHASADTRLVDACRIAIEDMGFTHFFAEFEMEGRSLPEKIRDNIRDSRMVVVLWTRNVDNVGTTRDIVNAEIGAAHMASKPVYVFREENTELPLFVKNITDYRVFKSDEYAQVVDRLKKVLVKLGKDEDRKTEETVFDGIVEVERDEAISLTLSKGDVVEGIMKEKNKQDFDCYIMTEKDYAKSCSDRSEGRVDKEFSGQSSYSVKWKVRKTGVWRFDFDNYGRQYPRTIEVRLRRIRPNP